MAENQTLNSLNKFFSSSKNKDSSLSEEERLTHKYSYINSIGSWQKQGHDRVFKVNEPHRNLLPKDVDVVKDKLAEFNVIQNPKFTFALREELEKKNIKQSIKNLLEKSKTQKEEKQKVFDYLKNIGSWNKEKNNAFEIKNEFRGLAAERLKDSDVTNDKYAEFKVAMSNDFQKNLTKYIDKKLAINRERIQNSALNIEEKKEL